MRLDGHHGFVAFKKTALSYEKVDDPWSILIMFLSVDYTCTSCNVTNCYGQIITIERLNKQFDNIFSPLPRVTKYNRDDFDKRYHSAVKNMFFEQVQCYNIT